ncbi:MAG TPA: NrsF family protein, partial [Candidatus Limnocylindria bacterium]|nr:NrsF family protein [Candidatus Limnocylindria bacterium]
VAWSMLPLAMLASFVAWHARPDYGAQLRRPLFVLDLASLVLAAAVSAWLALRAAVPGSGPARRDVRLALGLGGVGVLLLAWGPAGAEVALGQFVRAGWRCFLMTALLATPPLAVLLWALRRGAPLAPASAGALAGAGALLASAAAMRIACPVDDPLHLIAWHMVPILLGVALSAFAGAAWLGRWWLRPSRGGRGALTP